MCFFPNEADRSIQSYSWNSPSVKDVKLGIRRDVVLMALSRRYSIPMRRHDDGKARMNLPRLSRCGVSSGALRSAHHEFEELHYTTVINWELTPNGVAVEGLDPTVPSAATSLTLGVAESIASYHDNNVRCDDPVEYNPAG